jgi:lipopolysaccharide transport system permease protein
MAGLVDFGIAFVILLGMMFYYHMVPTLAVLTLPFFLMLALAAALSVGLWLSALNVKYRDIRYTLPFLVQFWLFITPIAYPISLVPEPWRYLCGLNPMAGVVEGFRWALLGKTGNLSLLMAVSMLVVVALLFGGLVYFRRMEKSFADMI